MDKRILTRQFLFYINVNLKLFSLLGEISFFKKMVPGRTNTHGLKITEEKVQPFYNVKKWIDILYFSDKDE